MNTTDNIKFNELERLVYDFVCDYAKRITASILEVIDKDIMNKRDTKRYRIKDSIKTTIKTLYGEVEYKRRYYFDNENNEYIFLMDKAMGISKVGLFSDNMAKLIVNECLNESFRKAAEDISNATAQNISGVGAWKLVQQVGQKIAEEEEQNISDMDRGIMLGTRTVNVLFQEADGIWLNMQNNKQKAPKMELKIATSYEGWMDNNRHQLVNRKIIAGMETGKRFMHRREAYIRSIYNYDDIKIKLLNGDGALWIKKDEQITYQQLDQFHMIQEIMRRIPDSNVRSLIFDCYKNKDIDKMLEYVVTYANSVASDDKKDKKANNARELYNYMYNNKDGLLKYNDVIELPEPEDGIVYRGMGVQENQNCTMITMRMKHRRMRWSVQGANNIAKVICSRANGDLDRHIEELYGNYIPVSILKRRNKAEYVGASTIKATVGKGDKYKALINKTMPILKASNNQEISLLRQLTR